MAAKKRVPATGMDGLFPTMIKPPPKPEEEGDEEEPHDQFCYQFNDSLPPDRDDRKCVNCKKYLTNICDQLEHFIDEDGDVE
jgi:hypothetical protein